MYRHFTALKIYILGQWFPADNPECHLQYSGATKCW